MAGEAAVQRGYFANRKILCLWFPRLLYIWMQLKTVKFDVFPVCVDLKPNNVKAGRGLSDHLFWTLHFVHEKQSSRGANLGVEPDLARKMGLCKDFKYWQSFTHHNYCYNPLFYFPALFWVHEKNYTLRVFFLTQCIKYCTQFYSLLMWRNNPLAVQHILI